MVFFFCWRLGAARRIQFLAAPLSPAAGCSFCSIADERGERRGRRRRMAAAAAWRFTLTAARALRKIGSALNLHHERVRLDRSLAVLARARERRRKIGSALNLHREPLRLHPECCGGAGWAATSAASYGVIAESRPQPPHADGSRTCARSKSPGGRGGFLFLLAAGCRAPDLISGRAVEPGRRLFFLLNCRRAR